MQSYRNSEPRPPIMAGLAARACPAAHGLGPAALEPLGLPAHPRNPADRRGLARQRPPRRLERAERDLDGAWRSRTAKAGRRRSPACSTRPTRTASSCSRTAAIAYERYFNGMTQRTLHLSQSVAKSVIGTVFGILAGRGVVDPARLVTDYLPELAATGWAGASAAACARHDHRRALFRGIHRPLFRYRPGRCRLRLETDAAGHRPGFSMAGAYVGADPAADRGDAPARRGASSTARSRPTCSPSSWSARPASGSPSWSRKSCGRRSAPTRAPASRSTAPAMRWPTAASTRRCATMPASA